MRAISMHQPWASATALGAKLIETRHASPRGSPAGRDNQLTRCVIGELISFQCSWNWNGALREIGIRMGRDSILHEVLPFGAIVAVVNLIDCRPVESFTLGELETPRRPKGETSDHYNWTERQMGNFELGRFGWVFADVRRLVKPVPFIGRQRWFNVPDSLLLEAA